MAPGSIEQPGMSGRDFRPWLVKAEVSRHSLDVRTSHWAIRLTSLQSSHLLSPGELATFR
jgi:hypothetical protein